jgi:hypothetical protein
MAARRLPLALQDLPALARTVAGDFAIAARNILRQGRRSAVALAAVTGGVMAMLIASGFFEWNFEFMRENSIRSRIGHIQVMKAGYLETGVADPFRYLIDERSPDRARIEGFEGVDVVAPRLGFGGLISIGDSTVSFAGEGVDPVKERKASDAILMLQGTNLSAIDAKEVLVGQGLAENLKLKIGDSVVLLASTASGGVNAVEVRVTGIFATITMLIFGMIYCGATGRDLLAPMKISALPFFLALIVESKQESEKEEMFLEFTRDLVEGVRSGTSISKSILNIKSKDYCFKAT